ncbi:MAG: hypothetical protein RLZ57_1081 [Actinomycetota bacterium]
MPASIEDQQKVLQLQSIDNTIAGLTNKLNILPESITHRELEIQFNTARDLRIAAETELKDITPELKRAENDVEQVATREAKDEARLSAGQGTPKELEQMQHELGSLKKRRAELEEIELEVMTRIEEINLRISQHKLAETELAEKVSKALELKNTALAQLNSDLETSKKNREILSAQIDKTILDIYAKLVSHGRTGAAKLEHGECRGCNLAINPVDLQKINQLPPTEIARCQECGCILVRN